MSIVATMFEEAKKVFLSSSQPPSQPLHYSLMVSKYDSKPSLSSDESTSVGSCCSFGTLEEADCQNQKENGRKKTVRFDSVLIRTHNITLGDNPSCNLGIPITLDWECVDDQPVKMDDYECQRLPKRKTNVQQLLLSNRKRKNRLVAMAGLSQEEIRRAEKEFNLIRIKNRMESSM